MSRHRITVLLMEQVLPLDFAIPMHVFAREAPEFYDVRTATVDGSPVGAAGGLTLVPDGGLQLLRDAGTVMIPGYAGAAADRLDAMTVDLLRAAAGRGARMVSICSGAFALARAGLLDGLTVTTHWRHASALAARYPALDVRPDPIYLRQGRIWTAAGVTAGIDLALALVEADHGAETAQVIARELVVFLRRPGGQSQFAGPVWAAPARQPAVRAAQDLIHADPAADLRVPVLAARVGMSERHFSREFTRALGSPPGDYVEQVRVDTARRLLESEPVLVSVAASRAGFGTAETMRRAFVRRLGVAPDHYRRRFAAVSS
jgi:transcriptional regulator GlxA family with amidase domain